MTGRYSFKDCKGCKRDYDPAWESLDICTKCCRAYVSEADRRKFKDRFEQAGEKHGDI